MARRHHRRHRRALMNPFSAGSITAPVKELVSKDNIVAAAGVAAGFVLPGVVMNYVPATWKAAKWQFYAVKVGSIALLSAAGAMVSKRVARMILLGGSVSLLLDIWTEFMGAGVATAPAATPAATKAYYGGPISAYYGMSPTGMGGDGMGDFDVP